MLILKDLFLRQSIYYREVFCLRQANWDAINESLRLFPWADCYMLSDDPEVILQTWISRLDQILKSHIRIRRLKISTHDQAWITLWIKHCKNNRRRLFNKAKLTNSQIHWENYRKVD